VGNNIIPELNSYFDICLFNTFRTYIKNDHYPVDLFLHKDDRGHLSEVIKTNVGGQAFFSVTKPGITRGNHFHRRKIERFCVVEGEALIKLRKIGTDDVIEYRVSGEKPATIDMPIFYTHNITNVGDRDMYTLFWSNEFFNPEDSDTFYEEV
jgi:UDP-2-acetamido-2,6-beta-L-arabino-hexul-4-ose reductase